MGQVTGAQAAVAAQAVEVFVADNLVAGCSTVDCSELMRYFPTELPAVRLLQSY